MLELQVWAIKCLELRGVSNHDLCCSAAEHIRRGEADLMLAGGADAAVIPSGIGGFIACKALSKRNDSPESASRPWDKNRDGFVMGEGAGETSLPRLLLARVLRLEWTSLEQRAHVYPLSPGLHLYHDVGFQHAPNW